MKYRLSKSMVLLTIWIVGCLLSCDDTPRTSAEEDVSTAVTEDTLATAHAITFATERFERITPSCATDSMRCAKMTAVYPLAVSGPPAVVQQLNDTILRKVKATLGVFAIEEEELAQPLEKLGDSFLEEYRAMMDASSDYIMPWEVVTKGKVLYQTEQLVSIELDNYSFTGGAHPNSLKILQSYDLRTGDRLEIADIVNDVAGLKSLAERRFRAKRELADEADLEDAGFFWGDPFAFAENYALTEAGLLFYYNPYEVAAYALGVTTFTIGYDELAQFKTAPSLSKVDYN